MDDRDKWAAICESVATSLLGEPNESLSTRIDWRWGRRGSFALNTRLGVWFDFETREGGGVIDLVVREINTDRAGAKDWLEQKGFLRHSTSNLPRNHSRPQRTTPEEFRPQSRQEYVRSMWAKSRAIPIDPDHPARRWFARRNLWRPEIETPDSLRWAAASRGGANAGAIVALIAPPEAWMSAWPSTPTPTAIQMLSVDVVGNPALDRSSESGGVSKRSLGTVKDGVFMAGNPNEWISPAVVAEGVADALALASRCDGPAVAMMSAGAMRAGPIANWLATLQGVIIFADNDGGPGPEAAQRLRHAINVRGGHADARFTRGGKDPAAAAAAAVFPRWDDRRSHWVLTFAAHLHEQYGWPMWECQRRSAIQLKGV